MNNKIEITGEMVFDMLPSIGKIYEKLELKKYALKSGKSKKAEELGMDMIFAYVFKNSPKIKNEVFEICGIALGMKTVEAKKEKLSTILNVFKTIIMDPELIGFFKQAV